MCNRRTHPYLLLVLIIFIKFEPDVKTCINRMNSFIIDTPYIIHSSTTSPGFIFKPSFRNALKHVYFIVESRIDFGASRRIVQNFPHILKKWRLKTGSICAIGLAVPSCTLRPYVRRKSDLPLFIGQIHHHAFYFDTTPYTLNDNQFD